MQTASTISGKTLGARECMWLFRWTIIYRVKYCVFSLKCHDFSELCQFGCSAGCSTSHLEAQAWSTVYTDTTEGKPRDTRESGIYLKIFEKTRYLMNTLYVVIMKTTDIVLFCTVLVLNCSVLGEISWPQLRPVNYCLSNSVWRANNLSTATFGR